MKKRVLIGIGPHYVTNPKGKKVLCSYDSYVQSLNKVGADAIILSPSKGMVPRYLDMIDGLLITGGDDLHPRYFGERLKPRIKLELSPDPRSDFDLKIIREALKRDLPFLGICLGCQSLNVALGGTLYQDIQKQGLSKNDHREGRHALNILEKSKLHKIFKQDKIQINSRHHQAIKTLGDNLISTGTSPDGVTEGIESTKHSFAIGVQWHPEEMPQSQSSSNLFKAFVNHIRKNIE